MQLVCHATAHRSTNNCCCCCCTLLLQNSTLPCAMQGAPTCSNHQGSGWGAQLYLRSPAPQAQGNALITAPPYTVGSLFIRIQEVHTKTLKGRSLSGMWGSAVLKGTQTGVINGSAQVVLALWCKLCVKQHTNTTTVSDNVGQQPPFCAHLSQMTS